MPNRYIREGINDSRRINSLSWQGEVFYRRLMLAVDDFGRIEADAELLRCELFKRQLAKVSEDDVERLLAECQSADTLFLYQCVGKRFLVMNKWEQGRAKNSKYPPPPEDVCKSIHMFTSVNGCLHMHLTPTPTPTPTPGQTPTRGVQPPASRTAHEEIKLEKELVRVGDELAKLGPLKDHEKTSKNYARILELRPRRDELRTILGVVA